MAMPKARASEVPSVIAAKERATYSKRAARSEVTIQDSNQTAMKALEERADLEVVLGISSARNVDKWTVLMLVSDSTFKMIYYNSRPSA